MTKEQDIASVVLEQVKQGNAAANGDHCREWRAELCRRAAIMSLRLAGDERSRREASLVRQAGVVFRRLRISKGLSRQQFADRLKLDRDFITFLESGLVCRDELSPLRQSLALAFNIDQDIIDVLLDGRAEETAGAFVPEPISPRSSS